MINGAVVPTASFTRKVPEVGSVVQCDVAVKSVPSPELVTVIHDAGFGVTVNVVVNVGFPATDSLIEKPNVLPSVDGRPWGVAPATENESPSTDAEPMLAPTDT
jgi:hypothetical protein